MNLVTVMNYDWSDRNYLAMCCTWIKQARMHLSPKDSCFIFSNRKLHNFIHSSVCDDPRFRFCIRDGMKDVSEVFFPLFGPKSFGGNFTYKLYLACQLDFPFVFVDADAFILDSIEELELVLDDVRVAFVDHERNITEHTDSLPPFINSGVFCVNDPNKEIMDWRRIFEHALNCGFCFRFKEDHRTIPGTDQAAVKSYLDFMGFNYRHEKFGLQYNTCAAVATWTKDENVWRVKNDKGDNVKIVHYWGPFKPWSLPCPVFTETIDDEMFCGHDGLDKAGKRQ